MRLTSTESFKVQDYQLEIVPIQDNLIQTYPSIDKGYLFHFYLGQNSINNWEDNDFKFSLDYDVKIIVPGIKALLEQRLDSFKNQIISKRESLIQDLDQFGYLFMFIVKQDDIHQLVISSDSFGLDSLANIYCNLE